MRATEASLRLLVEQLSKSGYDVELVQSGAGSTYRLMGATTHRRLSADMKSYDMLMFLDGMSMGMEMRKRKTSPTASPEREGENNV